MTRFNSARSRLRSATTIATICLAAGFLGACTSSKPTAEVKTKRSKEYFAESEYGVKASPRVSNLKSNLPRGGGRDQLGKPYKVRGKVYYPKEDKDYVKTGQASWYGDAFHGRLTANGEIYDMTHLTAAHPTMPLPSYAKVTNLKNGSSVIVRVNDRGPYSDGRVIDLSRRAAEMLDYQHAGTAKVKVEYVGRAPLDGHDDSYLMASYRPGDGMPTGVMIAMNGPTPSTEPFARAFDAMPTGSTALMLPELGPIAPERPDIGEVHMAMASLGYAPTQQGKGAFAAFDGQEVIQSWKRMNESFVPDGEPYIAAASFTDPDQAEKLAGVLAKYGKAQVETTEIDGAVWYGVNLRSDGRSSYDDMLRAAWSHGAAEAILIRD